MPLDSVGFLLDHAAKHPRSPWSVRNLWRGLRSRLRDVSGRGHPAITALVLREAQALISDELRWVQGAYERDGRRCAMGALQAAGRGYSRAVRRDAAGELLLVARLHGHHSVESMNDSLTHAEVMAMFETAISHTGPGLGRTG